MQASHRYAAAMAEGRLALGVFCVLDGYAASHVLATAGFDLVVFDRQHAAFDWSALENLCFRVRATDAAVFVRTASRDSAELDLTLDLPVDGIVVPNVTSAAEAAEAVRAARLPPTGTRSLGNERNQTVLGVGYDAIPEPMVALLVEHPGAVDEIEAISATPGVGALWVGTHDLAAAMGLDPVAAVAQPPAPLVEATRRVQAAAAAHGTHFWTTRAAALRDAAGEREHGATAAIWGVDVRMLADAARDAVQRFRDATG
jgi:4-hydroxy-2-oxoheptanedioate aldolase